jgi:glutamate synthase (NADPH/NADH) small chain
VLGVGGYTSGPVTIKQVEVEIANHAFDLGYVRPQPAPVQSGKRVAVVGSGPAGLAAAQQLARAGHAVTVFERDDRIGGLLRYGIPDFKIEKHVVDARLEQMRAEGVVFETGVDVGTDVTADDLRERFDAVLLAAGALAGRDARSTPGRDLRGVHLAMEHLVPANRVVAGLQETTPIDAAGKHVVIIGGGDTGADCLGVAHRQGAADVIQLDQYPLPPEVRVEALHPWPTWPVLLRNYPAHEEGGDRVFGVAVQEFVGDGAGNVTAVRIADVVVERTGDARTVTLTPGSERDLRADLVLLAIGFEGTEQQPLLDQFGLTRNGRGVLDADGNWQTDVEGVFVAGDMHRGASLIVWAIAEGRAAAAAIHDFLGADGNLPAPVRADAQPLSA